MIYEKKIDRARIFPSKADGKDGDIKIVPYDGAVYFYYKHNGEWYSTKLEKV